MDKKTKLVIEIMQLAYLIQANGKFCAFINFSGHIDQLEVSIRESRENWQNELLKTEFYTEYKKLHTEGNPLAYLEAKRNILAQIINENSIPYEECEVEQYLVSDYSF